MQSLRKLGNFKRNLLQKMAVARGWMEIRESPVQRVYDFRKYLEQGPHPKRALLSYLPEFVIAEAQGDKTFRFSNVGLAITLPKVLNQIGYEVDIISWEDNQFIPKAKYDLFIGHGAKNFKLIYDAFNIKPLTIYFSTGSYWKFHNEEEDRRLEGFKRRHGVELPRDRYIYESEEFANRQADAIICLGNEGTRLTYKDFPQVFNLPIASYPDPRPILPMTEDRRKSWLFYSGGGNIHKGLDLVLEAFDGGVVDLYICTLLDQDFEQFYHKLLFEAPNIHYVGNVSPRSEQYYEVMDKCAFNILPSCSEGSPGSVVECMQRGLIPVVTSEAHIDMAEFGWVLEDHSVDSLKDVVKQAGSSPIAQLSRRSKLARQAAQDYSIEKFEINLNSILSKILAAQS